MTPIARFKNGQTAATRVLILLGIVMGTILAVAGFIGHGKLREWELQQLTQTAETSLAQNDLALASMSARRALQIRPEHTPACCIMADLCERSGDVAAVAWRQRIVELNPRSVEARTKFAMTALRFGQRQTARTSLAAVSDADRNGTEYLAVSGAVALAFGDRTEAERCYSAAARAAPDYHGYRYSLAQVQSGSDDYFTRESGRALLSKLAEEQEFAIPALRSLITSFQVTGETRAALRESAKLITNPGHTFSDVLLRLSLLATDHDEEFHTLLIASQDAVAGSPKDAADLLFWMSSAGLSLEGLEWATQRSPEVGATREIRPALAACHLALKHWDSVLELTGAEGEDWGGAEMMRHAFRARGLRELGHELLSRSEWQAAVNGAGRAEESHRRLAALAADWKWVAEEQQALRAATEKLPDPGWAIKRLNQQYFAEGNVESMRGLAVRMLQLDPDDENYQNDFALLSLLSAKETEKAQRIAHDLNRNHPENAAYASTYAFALHLNDRPREALEVLRRLPPAQLEDPSVAAYYAVILVANGELTAAQHYLRQAGNGQLLPQERELVVKAAKTVSDAGH